MGTENERWTLEHVRREAGPGWGMRAEAGGYRAWRTGIPRLGELTGEETSQVRAATPALLLAAIRNAETSGPSAVSGKAVSAREPGRGGGPVSAYDGTQAPPGRHTHTMEPGGA